MAQFVITYLGGNQPATPEEGRAHFAKYMQWIKDLGEAAISPMNPLKDTHQVTPNGEVSTGTGTKMSGYTIIEADSIEAAVKITQACPFLDIGGTLEVSELVQIPG
ncbi:MAG: YciI family protein [Gammaproteobacteria bacterium]|nr:YciI family protein [Gammaproteobacteria bacterium]